MNIPLGRDIFRKYQIPGVPASGPHQPNKDEIVQWTDWLESLLSTGGASVVYATLAALNADLAHPANSGAFVYNDTTGANNGLYRKLGVSGAGSWTRVGDLPTSVVPLTVTGGTANAIVATATESPTLPGAKLYLLTPTANNTGATTIDVNGGGAIPIKNAVGSNLAAGSLIAGSQVLMAWQTDHYQLLISAAVDANPILADAVAAKVAAEAAAASVSILAAVDRTALKALDTNNTKIAHLREAGREGLFQWKTGNYSSQITADASEGIYIKANAIASSVGAWVRVHNEGECLAKWFGVVGDNSTNDAPAIQAAIDLMYAIYGRGKVLLPGRISKVTSTVTIKGGVRLVGTGRDATYISAFVTNINPVKFDSTCVRGCSLEDLTVTGYFNANVALVTTNTVEIDLNVPANISNCNLWYGHAGLFTKGIDGYVEDCWIMGCVDGLVSNGANWYTRCIFDTQGSFGSLNNAYTQGTSIVGMTSQENHFVQCDFSGPFAKAVDINGHNTGLFTITMFEHCVFSSPINILTAYFTSFSSCEFGSSSFTLNGATGGTVSVLGSVGYGTSLTLTGNFQKAANFNIS